MVSAVIFDCDGTLIDSLDVHLKTWKRAFEELGIPIPLSEEEIGKQFGKPLRAILSEVLPPRHHGKIAELAKIKRRYFMEQLVRAAEKLGEKPQNYLVVGDSIFDVLAAERACMLIVVVGNNPYQIAQIREKGVKIVKNITEILDLL